MEDVSNTEDGLRQPQQGAALCCLWPLPIVFSIVLESFRHHPSLSSILILLQKGYCIIMQPKLLLELHLQQGAVFELSQKPEEALSLFFTCSVRSFSSFSCVTVYPAFIPV